MTSGIFACAPRGPKPRLTISFLSVGQSLWVKMPTEQCSPQAPQVVHSNTAFVKSSSNLRSISLGPNSRALRLSEVLMNSLKIRIFSGGEIEGSLVTSCTGQYLRHSPH